MTNVTSNITCPDQTSTTSTVDLALTNLIQDLQNVNYRLKVGLSGGLGGGLLIAICAAIGIYIYYNLK